MATTIKFGNTTLKARTYKFPSRGNQAEDYFLLNGTERLDHTRARTTAGRDKTYTYVQTKEQMAAGVSFYVEGVIPSGTKIEVITVEAEPKAPKAPKEAAPAKAAAPAPAAKVAAPAPLKKRGGK